MTHTDPAQPSREQPQYKCNDCKDIGFSCTLVTSDAESRPILCPYTVVEGRAPWKKIRSRRRSSTSTPEDTGKGDG